MQSEWIIDFYNQYLDYKTNGFLIEIGVGHTLAGVDIIDDDTLRDIVSPIRCSSNTADLLDLGWHGIYIDPVKEYCDEAAIAHKNNLDRLKIINIAASDSESELFLSLGDSLGDKVENNTPYPWVGRKINAKKTSDILFEAGCPKEIDVLSVDVEGFEIKVLSGIDFSKHSPKLIITEVNVCGVDSLRLILNDYVLINNDGLNALWIRNDCI